MIIVGIDCATQPKRMGIARGRYTGELTFDCVEVGGSSTEDRLVEWLGGDEQCLVAMDAPLGWPEALGDSLVDHSAGEALAADSHALFRRGTDRFIKARVGKQPLDVGADRIARTAHSALSLLDRLRERTGESIPLAWTPDVPHRVAAVEVYPGGTLRARAWRDRGYKKKTDSAARGEIIAALRQSATLCDEPVMSENADALDAALCVLAGRDFLAGMAMEPENSSEARREGWIWCLDPNPSTPAGHLV